MQKLRTLTLVLLGVYALLMMGMSFHYHPQTNDPISLHCNFCHLTQMSQATGGNIAAIPLSVTPLVPGETTLSAGVSIPIFIISRAPPVSKISIF